MEKSCGMASLVFQQLLSVQINLSKKSHIWRIWGIIYGPRLVHKLAEILVLTLASSITSRQDWYNFFFIRRLLVLSVFITIIYLGSWRWWTAGDWYPGTQYCTNQISCSQRSEYLTCLTAPFFSFFFFQ